MMAKLGDVIFTLKTPLHSIKRDVGSQYEKIVYLLGGSQRFLVDSEDTIELTGTIYPRLSNGGDIVALG